jgi:CubicO group peptidase (beta-lactamase class C family)
MIATGWLVLLLLWTGMPAEGRADGSSLEEQIGAYLRATYPADEPGAAVIAVREGEVVYRAAHGMANLEHGIPLEPDMVFRLGSITKQFTAAAILLLEERGKLSIEDPITKFLPDYPVRGHEITVAHLVSHTSGIRSYTGIPGWVQTKIKQDLTLEELIDGFKLEPMDFAPGERLQYNNSGYVLLGAVIEKASGKSYEEFIVEEIFRPLGMSSSCYGDHARIIPRRVSGYERGSDGFRNAQYLSMSQPHAAGSLLSTVDDLAKWDAALYTDALLGAESRKKQVQPFPLNDGESTRYAYGLFIGDFRGQPMIQHGGGIFGFSTYGLRLPRDRVYVAVLTNGPRPVPPGLVAQKIAAMVIEDPFPDRKAISLAPSKLDEYTGVYRMDDDATRTVTRVDGQLFTQRTGGGRQPIEPESEKLFFYPNSFTYLTFERDPGGKVTHMLFYPEGEETAERAERTGDAPAGPVAVKVDPAIYERYVGVYEIGPGFDLAVTCDGERLFGQATGQGAAELFPSSETEFFFKVVDAQLRFVPGDGGRATHAILIQGGREIKASRKSG